MAKFDRKSQQLKVRVQFVRGTIQKGKGSKLTDAETETLSDQAIDDEIVMGRLEAVDRAEDAPEVDGSEGETEVIGNGDADARGMAEDLSGKPKPTNGRKKADA